MTFAVIVPADPTLKCRVEPWPAQDQTLDALYRWIDTDCVDSAPISMPGLGATHQRHATVWLSDDGLLRDDVRLNDRVLAFCRAHSYLATALAGNAVVSGGTDREGYSLGLPREIAEALAEDLNEWGA